MFLLGCLVLAAGTAIFKPGVQGTLVQGLNRRNSSVGWGFFYQVVNIGGFLGPPLAGMLHAMSWPHVFYGCAIIVSLNYLTLLTYKEVDSGGGVKGNPWEVIKLTFKEFFKPRLLLFIGIMSGFWLMLNQLWDMLPNFIEDWIDTSGIVAALGLNAGMMVAETARGLQIKQEWLINLNPGLIILFMIPVAAMVAKIRRLTSIVLGILLASAGLIVSGYTMSGSFVLLGIILFSFGEMVSSPKMNEYLAVIAPRVRLGTGSGQDGIAFNGGHGIHYNIVLDHLSVSWATDENAAAFYQPRDITLSNSILSEGLLDHSMGFLVREHTKNIAMIGNLFAHNKNRNPRVVTGVSLAAVNNVHYNTGQSYWIELDYGSHASYFAPHLLSAVGSVFLQGPNTTKYAWPILAVAGIEPGTKIYHSDNIAEGGILANQAGSAVEVVSSPPIWHDSIKPLTGDVKSAVLANVGARPADRDKVDVRIIDDVKNGTGSFISSAPSYSLAENHVEFTVPSNPNGDDDGDGYTNLEEALHQRAAEVEGR